MQINEIHELSLWYLDQIQGQKIDTLLQACMNRLKNNATPKTASIPAFNKDKDAVLSALNNVDYTPLTNNQRKCLRQLNVSSIVLEGATKEFTLLFNMHVNDTNFVISTLDRYLKSLKTAAQAFSQAKTALPVIVPSEFIRPFEVPEGKVLTRLTFHNEASINNLVEFNDWAKRWHLIARGFSIAIDQPVEDFEVVNADRGSFILDLLAGAAAMKLICESLKALTDLAVSLTDLKTKLENVKDCKELFPKEEFETLLETAERRLEKKEDEIVESVVKTLQEKGFVKNDTAINDLSRAIKEIHKFNSLGGSMTCLASKDDEFSAETVQQLNESYKLLQDGTEIRLLEDKQADEE
ncbi:hypothetical protein [Lacimicrobium alkaliphilum]|uniref:Uncharacterized protein n=1 Tax=Lacimicrobium alkaliphilum TaxID=1526571 RepID=A0A0U3B3J7_9ALTE|nr:hypothetical protein [Lacimicrobium alkaliphilum]ALS99648.1 hypothetical protein AT746_16180 [Lacimicrobium alkaliphilum]